MKKGDGYSHAAHTTAVLKSSKLRLAARIVLQHLCARADFKKPEVKITKPQIIRDTGLERKAVQKALAALRLEGTIQPIAHFEGGAGHAVTYRLCVVGEGAKTYTAPTAGEARKRDKEQLKRFSRLVTEHGYAAAKEMMAAE